MPPSPNRVNLIIPLSFTLTISILYFLQPNSFQFAWKGRAPYFIFLCLFFLEFLIVWKRLPKQIFSSIKWRKTLVVAATIAAPTIYVICLFVFGLSYVIIEIGKLFGAGRYGEWFLRDSWPLSFEYLIFTVFFTASIQLIYGIKGLRQFLSSLFFLGATGTFYMIDTFYPTGTLTALQSFVPFTASFATLVLDWMGYSTQLLPGPYGAVHMLIGGPTGGGHWYLYWPCAGIQSLFVYPLVILLFIKDIPFSPQREVIYASVPRRLTSIAKSKSFFSLLDRRMIRTAIMAVESFFVNVLRMVPICLIVIVGAVGTFIVNVLRIVSICRIGSKIGSEAAQLFHSYYGELYFITWVIIYLIILFLLGRRISDKAGRKIP